VATTDWSKERIYPLYPLLTDIRCSLYHMIDKENRNHNASLLLGCGGLSAILFFIAAFALITILSRDREAARYPGATPISSHSNYTGLPFQYRWDDSYLVDDNFTAVYSWYSITFNLGAESQANGGCILMDGQNGEFLVKRFVTVLVCVHPDGQMVYVTRTTAVNR